MKTKVLFFFVCLYLAPLTILSAKTIKGNGHITTKQISVTDYSGIEFGGGINSSRQGIQFLISLLSSNGGTNWEFNYSQKTGSSGVEVTIDENLLEYLNMETSGGILQIGTKGGNTIAPTRLIINGHSETLSSVQARSGVDFNILTPITGENLDMRSSGGSSIRIKDHAKIDRCYFQTGGGGDLYAENLECKELTASASGGSDIKLKGKAEKATFKASGGSDIKAFDFKTKEADFSVSGGSDLKLHVTELLSGSASGRSDVRFYGNPQQHVRLSGGSSCKQK